MSRHVQMLSSLLLISMMTYPNLYGLLEWTVGRGWVQFRSGGMEDGITLDISCFTDFSLSSLYLSLEQLESAWILTVRHRKWRFSVCGICQTLPLRFHDWLWHFRIHMISCRGWLFLCLFPVPSFLLYWQPRGSTPNEMDDVRVVYEKGPGHGYSVLLASHEP